MYKIVTLFKRRPGLTAEDFKAYYETTHSKIGERILRGQVVRYVRRYLTPVPHPALGAPECEFDVVMEMWFESEAHWKSMRVDPELMQRAFQDEPNLFDCARICMFAVEEHESDLAGPFPA